MPLRDIRPDLQDRLKAAQEKIKKAGDQFEAEIDRLQKQFSDDIKQTKIELQSLRALIEAEDRRMGRPPPYVIPAMPTLPLAEYFEKLIRTKTPRGKDELREEATRAGYFGESPSSAGRATHTTLLNLARSGRIRDMKDGNYGLPGPQN